VAGWGRPWPHPLSERRGKGENEEEEEEKGERARKTEERPGPS